MVMILPVVSALRAIVLSLTVLTVRGATGPLPVADAAGTHRLQSPRMSMHATGPFDVTITPMPADDFSDATTLGRMTIDKQYRGDLVGTGRGQMLTGMGAVKGSAAYSAIERVTGTLQGKRGSFVVQHTGIMNRGAQSLVITIVPDTGTEELAGITGTMLIVIDGKAHSYDLTYTLPAAP